MAQLQEEIVKAAPTVIASILTLALTWFVGQRLTLYWTIRQKKRELELAVVTEVYKLYGEFFAVWKLWNYYLAPDKAHPLPEEARWELLKRAAAAEAGMEAVYVRLASERHLSEDEIETLGCFRQAYQQLRQSIKAGKELGWYNSEHPEYLSFKSGATKLAWMINNSPVDGTVSSQKAQEALRKITSNQWEHNWAKR